MAKRSKSIPKSADAESTIAKSLTISDRSGKYCGDSNRNDFGFQHLRLVYWCMFWFSNSIFFFIEFSLCKSFWNCIYLNRMYFLSVFVFVSFLFHKVSIIGGGTGGGAGLHNSGITSWPCPMQLGLIMCIASWPCPIQLGAFMRNFLA